MHPQQLSPAAATSSAVLPATPATPATSPATNRHTTSPHPSPRRRTLRRVVPLGAVSTSRSQPPATSPAIKSATKFATEYCLIPTRGGGFRGGPQADFRRGCNRRLTPPAKTATIPAKNRQTFRQHHPAQRGIGERLSPPASHESKTRK